MDDSGPTTMLLVRTEKPKKPIRRVPGSKYSAHDVLLLSKQKNSADSKKLHSAHSGKGNNDDIDEVPNSFSN